MQADQAFGSVGAAGNEAGVSMVRKALVRRGVAAAAALVVMLVLILTGWSHERTANGSKPANRVKAPEELHVQVRQMLSHLDHMLRKQSTFLPKHSRGEVRYESLAMKIRLQDLVSALVEEVKIPGVCEKRTMIIEKLEALLKRLGGRAATVNSKDAVYRKKAEETMAVWLQAESNYRMNEAKHVEAKAEEKYVLHKFVIAQHVLELSKKDYKEVLEEYPIKLARVNQEKLDIEDLIQMIKKMEFKKSAQQNAEPEVLKYIQSEISSVIDTIGHGKPTKLNDIDAQVRHIRTQLEHLSSGMSAIPNQHIIAEEQKTEQNQAAFRRQLARDSATLKNLQDKAAKVAHRRLEKKLVRNRMSETTTALTAVTKLDGSDPDEIKNEIVSILIELLNDPEFRLYLLKSGLAATLGNFLNDKALLKKLEIQETDLGNTIDKTKNAIVNADMVRNEDAGEKIAAEEAYTNEGKEFVVQSESTQRSVFIIKTIIDKINAHCDKPATSDPPQTSTGGVIASATSAVNSLLAAAQSAASALVPYSKTY